MLLQSCKYTISTILIVVPLQQWLHEGVLMLRYTYIVRPVIHLFFPGLHSPIFKTKLHNNSQISVKPTS